MLAKLLLAALLLLALTAGPAAAAAPADPPEPSRHYQPYDAQTSVETSVEAFYAHQGRLLDYAWSAPASGYDGAAADRAYHDYGDAGAGLVMANGYAHTMQAQARLATPDATTRELQADCFAGAWLAERELDTKEPIDFPDVKGAIDGMLGAQGEQHALAAIFGWSGYDPGTGATPCLDTEALQTL